MTKTKLPQRGDKPKTPKEVGEYKCSCCGVVYSRLKGNFFASGSSLYASNQGYTTHCRNCVADYYKKLLGFYNGNAEKSMQHICALFDIYYNDNIFAATGKEATDSRVLSYTNKLNMIQYKATGKSYLETLSENQDKPQTTGKDEAIEEDIYRASPATIKFFGHGYQDEEYEFMQNQFDEWIERYEVRSKSEEELIKAICVAQLAIRQTQANRDIKEIEKAMNTFQSLLKTADLKPNRAANEAALSGENSFGMLIRKLENERPVSEPLEEFKDVDSIGKNLRVFFLNHICKLSKRALPNESEYTEELEKYTVHPPEFADEGE